jgi:hypothetical protein
VNQQDRDDRRNAATMIALFGLLVTAGALIAITFMVVPTLAYAAILAFGFVFVLAFHYVVWGRWLSNRPPPEDDDV